MKTSGANRIAERYVKALFEVAEAASVLNAVEKDMLALGHALDQNADFRHFLGDPLLSRETQADTMAAILAKIKAHEVTRQFIAMLTRQKRLAILREISEIFARWVEAARGEMTAELIAADTLKPADIARINERLNKACGKKVNLKVRQDSSLLGGMVVKIGSQQLDGSLAGKLNRLAITLKAA